MTPIQYRLAQVATVLIGWPMIFCLMNMAIGHGVRITEFEYGGITAATILRLYDLATYLARK